MKEEFEKTLMEFDNKSIMQKIQILGMASAFDDIQNENSEILKAFKEYRNLWVVMKSEDIAIVENNSNENGTENFKFTFARKIGGVWKRFHIYTPTLELAFLAALEHKYDARSGACFFAGKILNIIK